MTNGSPLEGAEMLTIPEVRALLEKEREERGELSYEQKLSFEHAQAFDRIGDPEKAKELKERLLELDRVSEEQAVKLVSLGPKFDDEVEVVFAKDRQDLSDEDSDTIISIVLEYVD